VFWGKVHDRVMSATQKAQEPFTYGALGGEQLYLNPPAPQPAPGPSYHSPAADLAMWQGAQSIGTADAYREYLSHYPQGQYSGLAKLQITALTVHTSSVAVVAPSGPKPHEQTPQGTSPGTGVRACAECPEMVKIAPGSFLMGSPANENDHGRDEEPVHSVNIRYSFWVSKYPVTRREWKLFVKDSGHQDPSDCIKEHQQDDHPVVCVTWQDAQDYIVWLTKKSGQKFRLLSESEYEFVQRAGTTTAYVWGATPAGQCERANGADAAMKKEFPWSTVADCNDGYAYTSPVGHFPANGFGLYGTTGNVWSWVQDCYHSDYNGAPADGSAWVESCTAGRVVRGGSWYAPSWRLRSAARIYDDVGNFYVGFRVVRTDF
jgi:formylglycine-generating enzyme required for sulfatase activity